MCRRPSLNWSTRQRVSPSRASRRRAEGREIVLAADAKVKPDLKGNLIVSVFGEGNAPFGKGKAQPPQQQQQRPRRFPFATLPAIPFEIVQK